MASISANGSRGHHKFTLNVTETGTNANTNISYVTFELVLSPIAKNYDWAYQSTIPVTYTVTINGSEYTGNIMKYDGTSTVSVRKESLSIPHNTDGSKSIGFSFSVSSINETFLPGSASADGTMALTNIPRYANITSFNVVAIDETTIKFSWSANATCDFIWFSTDNGVSWGQLSDHCLVGGLSAKTTYKCKIRVKRKDSQLTTDSSAISVTTYDYPHCIEAPAFTIGEPISLGFYNPLEREFTFYIIANGTTITNNWTISGTSYYGLGAESTKNQLYATIPESQDGGYKVKVVYGDSTKIYNSPNKFKVNPDECTPTSFEFDWLVSPAIHTEKTVIKGLSTINAYIHEGKGATAKNSAYMSRYEFTLDTLTATEQYRSGHIYRQLGCVNSAGVKRFTVRAYDSRGLYSEKHEDITIYDWGMPVINAEIKRLNNFEAETTLKVSGTYSPITFDGTDYNGLAGVTYQYRETGGTWSNPIPLTATLMSGKFTCNDVVLSLDNSKSFEFKISATDLITLNSTVTTLTVDIGQAIFFISTNKKKCYINGVEVPTVDMLYPTGTIATGDSTYPIGSVYCNSTNTNPSDILGGTWELIDKGFNVGLTEKTQTATEYLSAFKVISVRGSNTIRLRINGTTAKEIGETTVNIGTLNLAEHGLANDGGFFPATWYSGVAVSDGSNAVILAYLQTSGVLQIADGFTSAGVHTLPAGTPFYLDVTLPVKPSQMLDEFCDKFYWKRTA